MQLRHQGRKRAQGQACLPEFFKERRTSQTRKPWTQGRGVNLELLLEASPPATDSLLNRILVATRTGLVIRTAGQKQHKHRLLHRPEVPAAGWDHFREDRAGRPASGTNEPQDRNRVKARRSTILTDGFPGITAMAPESTTGARRALLRSICVGIDLYGSKMVGEGTNACEDNGHDGVPLVMRSRANVSCYQRESCKFKNLLSRLVSGNVLNENLKVHGTDTPALPARRGDVTQGRITVKP